MPFPLQLTLVAREATGFSGQFLLDLPPGGDKLEVFSIESRAYVKLTRTMLLADTNAKIALRDSLLLSSESLAAYAILSAGSPVVKLVAFDTDSTFINQEVIDEIAGYAGFQAEVAEITERAMRGELDFNAALAARVSLLAGLPATTLEDVRVTKLSLTTGAVELTNTLHAAGVKTCLLSGGFSYFTQAFRKSLNMTADFANELEIVDGSLTGKTRGEIVNRQRKAKLLATLAQQNGISLQATAAVGDGANDIDMCAAGGVGIAFCAKPALLCETFAAIFERDLRLVTHLIAI